MDGRFDETIFLPAYQRNNKRGGLKNLRCFPACGAEHRLRGFCGRSVLVTLKTAEPCDARELFAWCNFEEVSGEPRFAVGSRVMLSDMDAQTRTKNEPTLPLIGGQVIDAPVASVARDPRTVVMDFNRERRGWHYGWPSNKHTSNDRHYLRCSVFKADPAAAAGPSGSSGALVCVATFTSPQFILFSRRRRRITVEPTAPIASPVKVVTTENGTVRRVSYKAHKERAMAMQELEVVTSVRRIEAARKSSAAAASGSSPSMPGTAARSADSTDSAASSEEDFDDEEEGEEGEAGEEDVDDDDDEDDDGEDDECASCASSSQSHNHNHNHKHAHAHEHGRRKRDAQGRGRGRGRGRGGRGEAKSSAASQTNGAKSNNDLVVEPLSLEVPQEKRAKLLLSANEMHATAALLTLFSKGG